MLISSSWYVKANRQVNELHILRILTSYAGVTTALFVRTYAQEGAIEKGLLSKELQLLFTFWLYPDVVFHLRLEIVASTVTSLH